MKESIAAKLQQLTLRLEELNGLLSSEHATDSMDNYRKLTREHSEITPVVELYGLYRRSEDDMRAAEDMAADPSMREFAETEIKEARARLEKLEAELQKELLPKDPNDDRNIFLEIRAGTGGDESRPCFRPTYFACTHATPSAKSGRSRSCPQSQSELGGYKEVIARTIAGQGAYSKLQSSESGGHRVMQRAAHHRDAGAHPHVGVHGGGAAGGRCSGRRRVESCRDAHRYLPLVRRRRPAYQQDRFGDPHYAPADRYRGRMPGRPLAAQEQGARWRCLPRASRMRRCASRIRKPPPRVNR